MDGWPVLMPGHWKHEIERAVRLGREIGVRPVVYGLHEGHRASEFLASENVAALVSLKWPEADEDRDPEEEEPLRALRMREQAPKTPAALTEASEEQALALITINPAKQLRIDDRVGSIEVGKDADFAIFDTHPLSVYAIAQKTIVDGKVYFDREEDAERQKALAEERAQLLERLKTATEERQ